ncbi:MurR/RpiR family transcriptional regulator [Gemmobacter caeruleus]|uniref:MurR/RpiR family transcriptional regulator n=1 Tax=Gemmobacter caeruleus TaxID=2595004 RepID=UPI0011EBDFAF|nr:MurR/RpiR family transcriptional regulator [Gemmobacter caeruleus]
MTAPPDPPAIAAPPDSLDGLRALALGIARGEAGVRLGAKAGAALARLLDMVGDPALLSITSLAARLEVHPSTLTRLATSLGYAGFPALQHVLLSASLTAPGAFYSRQARAALDGDSSPRARAAQLCHENQALIDRFIESLDEARFEAMAAMIMAAPRVLVHGIRQFHAVASFLVYGLRMIRRDVALLDADGLGMAEGLAMLGEDGLLISASCAPYSAQVVAVAAEARRRGLATLAITDHTNAPLAQSAQAVLLVGHETSFLSNSIGAFVVATECLINACAAARPEAARAALRDREALIARLGVETG